MSTTNINKRVKELKELQRMSDELNAEIESIKDELKAEMAARNTDEILTSECKLKYKEVSSSRFDTTSFKNKYIDLYNQFLKVTTSKRFTIA